MKFSWEKFAADICAVLGALSWLYLGAYRLWKGPVLDLIEAHFRGNVSVCLIVEDFFRGFLCLTFAGFVWCLWYILRGYFKDRK